MKTKGVPPRQIAPGHVHHGAPATSASPWRCRAALSPGCRQRGWGDPTAFHDSSGQAAPEDNGRKLSKMAFLLPLSTSCTPVPNAKQPNDCHLPGLPSTLCQMAKRNPNYLLSACQAEVVQRFPPGLLPSSGDSLALRTFHRMLPAPAFPARRRDGVLRCNRCSTRWPHMHLGRHNQRSWPHPSHLGTGHTCL